MAPASDPHAAAPPLAARQAWAMLLALTGAFVLSQAFRTLGAIMGPPLAAQLQLSAQQLGLWSAAFHFSFGAMQLAMGVSLDLWGVRRTILLAFPVAVAGALLSSQVDGFGMLLLGQALIGAGCAPAFLVCTVFIGRHFASERFTAMSGLTMSLSGLGVLATASPLAWLIERSHWRWGFGVLAGLSVLVWLVIAWRVHEPARPADAGAPRPTALDALRGLLGLFALPQTAGVVAYAAVGYAAFITLRGLWLGPLLVQRFDLSLLQAGHVALAMTLASMASPAIFGRLDPGGARRLRWLLTLATVAALLLATIGLVPLLWLDVLLAGSYGLISGFGVLQYGYVNDAYPPALRGRAMSLLTMAMFLGVSLMQWASGLAASLAPTLGVEPFSAALLTMAAMLLAGALALWKLPRAPLAQ